MVPHLGVPELLIILVIVILIFGAGRVTDIMGALGRGIREFRKGTSEGESTPEDKSPKSA